MAANDRGDGPATVASRDRSASEIDEECIGFAEDLYKAAALEIDQQFHARLKGLRRMPRCDRAVALRAAREWRRACLQALKERCTRERRARTGARNRRFGALHQKPVH